MIHSKLSTEQDALRMQKKLKKLQDELWKDMNKVSGLDPQYGLRRYVWEEVVKIYDHLEKFNPTTND